MASTRAASRTSDRILTWILLPIAAILLSVIALELLLRLLYHHDDYLIWPPNIHHTFQPSSEIMHGITGTAHFTTNAHGFRARPLSDRDTHRILAIGGSTTENLYLDDSEAWPAILESIAANHGFGGVWVGNAGRSGRNSRHHVVQLHHLLQTPSSIDSIIVLSGVNDLTSRLRQGADYESLELREITSDEDILRRSFAVIPASDDNLPLYKQTQLWIAIRNLHFVFGSRSSLQNQTGEQLVRWREDRRASHSIIDDLPDLTASLEEYRQNLAHIIELAIKYRIKLFLVTQPAIWSDRLTTEEQNLLWMGADGRGSYYSVEALAAGMRMYNEVMLDLCREHEIDCIDLERKIPKTTSMFYDDVHFTEAGARQVATVIGQHVVRWLSGTGNDLLSRLQSLAVPRATTSPGARSP